MAGDIIDNASGLLGFDAKAAAATVSVTTTTGALVAAGASAGLYRVVVGSTDIYARQGEAATTAAGHLLKADTEYFIAKEGSTAINAITASGTSSCQVGLARS